MQSGNAVVNFLKKTLPEPIYEFLMRARDFLRFWIDMPQKTGILLKNITRSTEVQPKLSYALMVPGAGEISGGGRVKLLNLSRFFPEQHNEFNILYLVSSALPKYFDAWAYKSKKHGIKTVLNQNGVFYKAGYGKGWRMGNRPLQRALNMADHIIYQSNFCKQSSDMFIGKADCKFDIVYNAVDTAFFTPYVCNTEMKHPVIVLGGNQYEFYRYRTALMAVAIIKKKIPDIKLLITGELCWDPNYSKIKRLSDTLINDLNIEDNIKFTGPYQQKDAPDIFRKGHVLLHTKYYDPCPTVVLEAMACGLPVVYPNCGGVPELVDVYSGVGVDADLNWEESPKPNPEHFAEAILTVIENIKDFSEAARERAVSNFDVKPWIEKHRAIFTKLIN